MSKFEHLMLDLETMGTKSNSCIVSIGAVEFNIETGETGKEFYQVIDLQSSLNQGLEITGSTLEWWLQQSDKARNKLNDPNKVDLNTALYKLTQFITKDYYVWGNSSRFDCGILADSFFKINYTLPWKFWNERDVRTLVSFAPQIKESTEFQGVPHDPIDDCKHQIKYCSKIWNKLNTK